ncbi:AraC-like DNA-binding protein [Pseudacidovorax sp. 1753]|uniref:AraC family transcriptional regulator n=1 Tax=Pseudacidovorax sp. 1753 TaxID=3156419 RepID=UPI0033936520
MVLPSYAGEPLPSFRDVAGAASTHEAGAAYTVPLWCTLRLLGGALRRGFAREAMLRHMRVPPARQDDPQWPVPVADLGALLRHLARRMDDELVGLWVRPVPFGSFSSVARQLLHCARLGEALQLALRLYRLIAPGFPLRLRVTQGLARLEMQPQPSDADVTLDAAAVYWTLALARWLVDRPIPVHSAWMHSPAQDSCYRERQPFFEVPTQYGCARTGIAFDAGWLNRPLARSAQSLEPLLAALPAPLMRAGAPPPAAAEQVCSQLQLHGGDGFAGTLQSVARTLGLSPRSLRRRLQEEGCSWHDLKDAMRREQALDWVSRTDLSLAEIGERLGFADVSTFHRAFKRWTGEPPGEFRRQHQGRAAPPPSAPASFRLAAPASSAGHRGH